DFASALCVGSLRPRAVGPADRQSPQYRLAGEAPAAPAAAQGGGALLQMVQRARLGSRGVHHHVRRLIPLAFLAPAIVEAICAGQRPADLTAEKLTRRMDLPLDWEAQEALAVSSLDARATMILSPTRAVRRR